MDDCALTPAPAGTSWRTATSAPAARKESRTTPEAGKRLEAAVESGDMVSLVVGAKEGNHICDTTIVELAITETGAAGGPGT